MRILFLSFYFRPDLCAGSFRATALVDELSKRLGAADEIQVLTTVPNRYRSFRTQSSEVETQGNVQIRRLSIPSHRSGVADQSRAFAAYARAVIRVTARERYDLVFATSSRLMTAVLGAVTARRAKAPLYLDIRDILPDTLSDVFAGKPQKMALPLLRGLESWTIRTAAGVNLVSPGFVDYFRRIRDDIQYRTFTNGIDEVFLGVDFANHVRGVERRVIVYAGNIGEGQGLERVVPEAAARLESGYEFWIVGDGGMRPEFEKALAERGVGNVRVIDPVSRDRLTELYAQADILFLHLNDYPAFRKVLPSKIFEYAATGKPMLAGVGGYARRFIEDNVSNAAVFDPCDVSGLVHAIDTLSFLWTPRTEFVERFRRSAIIRDMADDVLNFVQDPAQVSRSPPATGDRRGEGGVV